MAESSHAGQRFFLSLPQGLSFPCNDQALTTFVFLTVIRQKVNLITYSHFYKFILIPKPKKYNVHNRSTL